MRTLSRFIPGEEIDAVARWDFGSVDVEALRLANEARAQAQTRDLARDEAMRQEGFAEGFAQGKAHAIVEEQHRFDSFLRTEAQGKAQRFATVLAQAQEQLARVEQGMADAVLEMTLAIARQVLRQELSLNPNVLLPVVREAMGLLAADTKAAVVRLHPLDAEVFQDELRTEFAQLSLTLVADAAVGQGGCMVESAGTIVDGRLDARWRRAIGNLGLESAWDEKDA